jgi:hypothetical protein
LRFPLLGKSLLLTILRAGEVTSVEVEIMVRLGGRS